MPRRRPAQHRSAAWRGRRARRRRRTGSRSATRRPRTPPRGQSARRARPPRTTADVQEAGLRRHAPPRVSGAGVALWAGRVAVAGAAFAVGTALGHANDPLRLALLAGLGGAAVAAAV